MTAAGEVFTAADTSCGYAVGLGRFLGCEDRLDPVVRDYAVRLAGRLAADLRYTTVEEIMEAGLHSFIDDLQSRLNDIGTSIFETFVLYGDTVPVTTPPSVITYQPGAWHAPAAGDAEVQQQQQQQQ